MSSANIKQEDDSLIKKSSSGNLWESVMNEIESRKQEQNILLSRPVSMVEDGPDNTDVSVRTGSMCAPKRPPRKKRPAPPAPPMAATAKNTEEKKPDKNVRNDLEKILEAAFVNESNDIDIDHHEQNGGGTLKAEANNSEPQQVNVSHGGDEFVSWNSRTRLMRNGSVSTTYDNDGGLETLSAKDRSTSFLSVNDLDAISYCSNYTDGSLDDSPDDQLLLVESRPASNSVNLGTPSHQRRLEPSNSNAEKRYQKVRGKIKSKAAAGKERMGAFFDAANSATGRFKRIRSIRNKTVGSNGQRLDSKKLSSTPYEEAEGNIKGSKDFLNRCGISSNNSSSEGPDLKDPNFPIAKKGALRKQGGKIKNWNTRWFVLRADGLHYFYKENGKYIATIPLKGNRVVGHSSPGEGQQKQFLFEICPGKDKHRMTSNHESFLISTNNDKDMDEWVRAIHRIILSPFGGGIFGQALEETLRHDKRLEERNTCVVSEREVPVIVENCVHFIRKNGMTEEGIFRLNGNTNEVKALEDEYNAGERPIFDNATDVHAVTSLLKLYLRKLPVPVIPFNQFDDLISIAKLAIHHRNDTEEERAAVDDEVSRKIFHHIGLLPPANHSLLRYLARFLYEVSQSSEYNKMDISNLALVIAPNLIHTKLNDAMAMMNFQTHIRYIMEQFISGHRKYFPDESLPDVAARTNISGSPTTTTVTAQASSNSNLRDPGIGTLNSTASPLGTLDQSHAAAARQYPQAAEDSGTGSLGPTPDNTYRPPVSSSSVASGSTTSATRIKPAKPPRRKPTTPAHHSSGGGTSDGERLAEAEKRRSVYDNINQATHQATAVNITNDDDTKSVSSYSTISSHINQPTIQSSIDSGDKASIKAYRGSSSEQESLHTVDYYERCGSTRQETMDEVTDDESNTESIVGDRTSQSISSLVDQSTFNMGSYSSIKSLAKSPVASTSVESARPGTSGLRARRCAKNDVNDLISKSESDPPLTTVTSLNPPFDGHLMLSSLTPSKPDSSSVSTDTTGNKPTYQELEQTIQYLKNEVKRMNKEQEKRSRMIEDHLLDKMRLGGNFSAPITSANATFTYPTPEITSGTSSVVGYDSSVFELSFSEMSTSNSNSNPSTPAQHERRYWEEVKRHKMTCIQLRNAMRGLEQEKMRNITLQKEMQEFYTTFSNLTSDDVNPKSSAT